MNHETLEYNLAWRWSNSFRRIEELPNGKVAAFFSKSYRTWNRSQHKFYEVKIIFHPHPYEAGIDWHFGAITFGGARLPKEHKDEIREQFRRILKNFAYVEERKNPYAVAPK